MMKSGRLGVFEGADSKYHDHFLRKCLVQEIYLSTFVNISMGILVFMYQNNFDMIMQQCNSNAYQVT